jgi:general nucleoside transport system permease protein
MDAEVLVAGFLAAAVRVATPLMLAATGETITERSGVINLGLEGTMLAGALAATLGATAWGPWSGVGCAIVAGMLLAAVFALLAVGARADQIITGTAITLAAVGLTGTIYRQAYGSGGAGLTIPTLGSVAIPGLSQIPVLGPALFDQPAPTYLALLGMPIVWWVLFRTRLGLALRATGEGAAMARAAGVRTNLIRSWAAGSLVWRGPVWYWPRSVPSPRG